MTQFVGTVVETLDIDGSAGGPTISRVGLVTFSDSAVLQFNLDRYTTKAELLQAVNVPYLTGSTNTQHAIRFATDEMFRCDRGDRSNFANHLVIMTDGNSDNATAMWREAIRAQSRGINIITVGAGDSVNYDELRRIASEPAGSNVVVVDNFDDETRLHIANLLCNNVDKCAASPCRNGGTCVNDYGRYFCLCSQGFAGYDCDRRSSAEMDVVFVIPTWSVVSPPRYEYALMFVGNVTSGLDIDSGNVRVGVVAFPVSPVGQFYLRDHVGSRQDVIDALTFYRPDAAGQPDVSQPEASTNAACETLCALNQVRNTHLTGEYGARPGARKVVVLVGDGYSVDSRRTLATADSLKANGAVIYGVANGERSQLSELTQIASSPDSQYVLQLRDIPAVSDTLLKRLHNP